MIQAVGPAASLIFAAWIFLSFLQQRYASAYQLYRTLVDRMRRASNIGLIAAILLIVALIAAALYNMSSMMMQPLKYISAISAGVGLVTVVPAAIMVMERLL